MDGDKHGSFWLEIENKDLVHEFSIGVRLVRVNFNLIFASVADVTRQDSIFGLPCLLCDLQIFFWRAPPTYFQAISCMIREMDVHTYSR